MQRDAGSKSEFDVKTELFETEEVFANVFCEVSTHELLATVVEGTGPVSTGVIHSWSQEFSVV